METVENLFRLLSSVSAVENFVEIVENYEVLLVFKGYSGLF